MDTLNVSARDEFYLGADVGWKEGAKAAERWFHAAASHKAVCRILDGNAPEDVLCRPCDDGYFPDFHGLVADGVEVRAYAPAYWIAFEDVVKRLADEKGLPVARGESLEGK